jgi:hypothetical protein
MNWELAKRSTKCVECQRVFDLGEGYNTGLSQTFSVKPLRAQNPFEETGTRLDYCPECWEKRSREKNHEFSWKGHIVEEVTEPKWTPPVLNREQLLVLLREHWEASIHVPDENERVWKNGVAYFIALLMERKRWLTHREDRENNGVRCAVYEDPKSKETFLIAYPLLNNLSAYQEEISRILNIPVASISV